MVTLRSGLLHTGSSAHLSLWHVWNASSMAHGSATATRTSFLLGDCHADPGVDFGVAQWVTIP